MKYKVGDKVVLRDDLEDGKFYGQEKYVEYTKLRGMETILGKEVEVCDIDTLCYIICGTPAWRITDDMIDHEKTATLNGENYAKYMEEQINDPAYQELLKELSEPVVDTVNHPPHYTQGKIEVIDIIEVLTEGYTGYQGYLVGNVVKYIARANFKGNKQEDLEKAEFYYKRLLEDVEGDNET